MVRRWRNFSHVAVNCRASCGRFRVAFSCSTNYLYLLISVAILRSHHGLVQVFLPNHGASYALRRECRDIHPF
ncbi:hypothetical protein ACQKWADRAFT_207958 [Trichoderma austrokoningii]